jgi:hypothetical protein
MLVAPGTYKENINFNGKAITVKSNFQSILGHYGTMTNQNANGPVRIAAVARRGFPVLVVYFVLNRMDETSPCPTISDFAGSFSEQCL